MTNPGKDFKQTKYTKTVTPIKRINKRNAPTKSRHSFSRFDRKTFKTFKRMLEFTLSELFPDFPKQDILTHTAYIKHLYQSKGPEYILRYLKATHESLEYLVLGLDGKLEHEKVSIGKDDSGWPKWLGLGLKRRCLVDKDPVHIRYVLTLCSTRRLIVVPTFTYLKSITEAPSAKEDVIETIPQSVEKDLLRFSKFVNRLPEIGSQQATNEESVVTTHPTPALEVSLKAGPNGISFFTFPWDRAAIQSHNLVEALEDFLNVFYSGDIDDWVERKLEPYTELVDSNRQLNVGKVSHTFEGGKLKGRIFAIVDSLTQSVLAPFHRGLMSMLRTIPEDCTFDHAKVSATARKKYSEGHTFYGYADLSNASDAIDKRLYVRIGNLWLQGLGDSWVHLFDRDFIVPESVKAFWDTTKKQKTHVRYNTGQPMGALSSWPFMAMVHHTIVCPPLAVMKLLRASICS